MAGGGMGIVGAGPTLGFVSVGFRGQRAYAIVGVAGVLACRAAIKSCFGWMSGSLISTVRLAI